MYLAFPTLYTLYCKISWHFWRFSLLAYVLYVKNKPHLEPSSMILDRQANIIIFNFFLDRWHTYMPFNKIVQLQPPSLDYFIGKRSF